MNVSKIFSNTCFLHTKKTKKKKQTNKQKTNKQNKQPKNKQKQTKQKNKQKKCQLIDVLRKSWKNSVKRKSQEGISGSELERATPIRAASRNWRSFDYKIADPAVVVSPNDNFETSKSEAHKDVEKPKKKKK